jgi:hypothetical protein
MSEENSSDRPAFSAPLYAALRQGAKELAQALPAFPESVRVVEEPGTLGNPTQQMVTQEIGTVHGYDRMLDSYADRGQGPSQPEKEPER